MNLIKKTEELVISIDGPAGAGKSTIARMVAEKCGLTYVDSGAMYRAVTLLAIKNHLDPKSKKNELVQAVKDSEIVLLPSVSINEEDPQADRFQRVFLNGEDVTQEIRTREVTELVSEVSAIAEIRLLLVELQRDMGKAGGVIMDGRDIGTHVFPHADLKIFLIASSRERAIRRQKQLLQLGRTEELEKIQAEIEKRDHLDSTREVSPLKKAEDAVLIDTDGLSVNEVFEKIVALIEDLVN
jgi:cytidylate kinase